MKYRIGAKCIQCFACIRNRVCREEAIIERNGVYSIDESRCTDCGTCFTMQQYFCPVRAFIENDPADSDSRIRGRSSLDDEFPGAIKPQHKKARSHKK